MSMTRQVRETTKRQRATPLNPYPQAQKTGAFSEEKPYPPELGTDSIAILEGRTFMCSNALGDIPAGSIGGLLHNDTRFASRWELTLADKPLSLLKSAVVDYYSASFFLTNPDLPQAGLRANSVAVRRLRFIGNGVVEQIVALNSVSEPVRLELKLGCGADFADLFEVKSAVRDRSQRTTRKHETHALRYIYEVPGFLAETTIRIKRSDIADVDARRVVSSAREHRGHDLDRRSRLQPDRIPLRHDLAA